MIRTMTIFRVTTDIFAAFPDVVLGIVIAHGIDNGKEDGEALSLLRREEERVRRELAGIQVSEHPHVAPWREAYRRFGAKPKDYPSSIENLLRRVLKGHSVPHINTLVDLYNTTSLRHLVPVGGEDLEATEGDVLLTAAGEAEAPVLLLGEPEPRAPRPGEIIYKDDRGAICRRWNWKEADRTKLTTTTRHAVLVLEGLPPVGRDLVERATEELAGLVRTHCGGSVRTALVDRSRPEVSLS
jgi:DNA/RNA-binding domain of Phe-tRNA-synthetase-like protein